MRLIKTYRKSITSILCLLAFLGGSSSLFAANKQVLILHDSSGPTGHIGKEFAIMLENLLGHFDADISILPVSSYTAGLIDSQDATFYIGSSFNEEGELENGSSEQQNYRSFLGDAATTDKPMTWMNFNLNSMIDHWDPAWGADSFTEKTGIQYIGFSNEPGFNRVKYKNVELDKGVTWGSPDSAPAPGCTPEPVNETSAEAATPPAGNQIRYACSKGLVGIDIADSSRAEVIATASTTLLANQGEHEYITRSGNFWFIGDIPFTFLSAEDRYLAFADVLHDILGTGPEHEQSPTALLRLEDVSAGINPAIFKKQLEFLDNEAVPFSIAAVPAYEDPNAKDIVSAGVARSLKLPQSEVAKIIEPYYQKGLASIVAHGYTHQYANKLNPFDGVTGKDYEFYRVTLNAADESKLEFIGPIPEDSAEWAKERMCKTEGLLRQANFKAFAWEAPHYLASKEDYLTIKELYPVHYGRTAYFNPDNADGQVINQLFPYIIKKDSYGYHQIPENIGNIQTTPRAGFRVALPEDLIRAAEKIKVVRDGIASFYYHPFLKTEDLSKTITGLKDLGYTFKAPCSLSPAGCPDPSAEITGSPQCSGVAVDSDSGASGGAGTNTDDGGGSSGFLWLLLMAGIRLIIPKPTNT